MHDLRRIVFVSISSLLLLGTIYSVAHNTYLDTSNPLVALGHKPHPLHDASYFARKTNILNVVFIKRAWAWTTVAFISLVLTSPSALSKREQLKKYGVATAVWLVFATWFFGPALMNRLTRFSGGECVVGLPSGKVLEVPMHFCDERTVLSPSTHPHIFFVPPVELPAQPNWHTTARLMRGHDTSGHVFILTLSLLFLADAIRPSFKLPSSARSQAHTYALLGTSVLMGFWLLAVFTTAIYFHTPFEKLTGYLIGLAGFLITQLPIFKDRIRTSARAGESQAN